MLYLQDVNDEIPKFRSNEYIGEIVENSQRNTPVTMIGEGTIAEVFDHDQGTNGTFKLILEDPTDMFEVSQLIHFISLKYRMRKVLTDRFLPILFDKR